MMLKMSKLLLDDDLVEGVVFLCTRNGRPDVPPQQIEQFHREREAVYARPDPDQRNTAFAQLHQHWFQTWGLEALLRSIIVRFPLLESDLDTLAFRQARSRKEEAAELYVNAAGTRHGVVALRPARLVEPALEAFLNHEFQHLQDMLDPAFGYSPHLSDAEVNPSQTRLFRERYRLLWDITIDARLTRSAQPTVASPDQRRNELDLAWSFLSEPARSSLFHSLWSNPKPRHRELVELASDPRGSRGQSRPGPGAVCPLCGFPGFHWADPGALPATALERIRQQFPGWRREQGICQRCAEMYAPSGCAELTARFS